MSLMCYLILAILTLQHSQMRINLSLLIATNGFIWKIFYENLLEHYMITPIFIWFKGFKNSISKTYITLLFFGIRPFLMKPHL